MTLRITLDLPERLPLAEPLVGVVRLTNDGTDPVATSSRLNLVEGDLSLTVTGPDGGVRQVRWPYPVDSGLRRVTLAPGAALEGGVLLLDDAATPGTHRVAATFAPTPREEVVGAPVDVARTGPPAPWDATVARALAQAVAGAADLGNAGRALAGTPVGRLLAVLAEGDVTAGRAAAAEVVADRGAVFAAAAAAALVPPGLFPGDARLAAVAAALVSAADTAAGGRVAALLAERPFLPA